MMENKAFRLGDPDQRAECMAHIDRDRPERYPDGTVVRLLTELDLTGSRSRHRVPAVGTVVDASRAGAGWRYTLEVAVDEWRKWFRFSDIPVPIHAYHYEVEEVK